MLYFVSGDMFSEPAGVRVNTVNCVGVMGKGVALAFKNRFPAMFESYRKACFAGEVRPGKLHVFTPCEGLAIVNFPTKRHWRDNSRYEDVEVGLIALRRYLRPLGNVRVTVPALGCGHGGLSWQRVQEMIVRYLSDLDAQIFVYSPADSRTMK